LNRDLNFRRSNGQKQSINDAFLICHRPPFIRRHQFGQCKGTNKFGNKEELSKKNRLAIKKVPKYLELIGILRIFAA
jgi:hypothetical protein